MILLKNKVWLRAGPYLDFKQASAMLMDHSSLIVESYGHNIDMAKVGYLYECYIENFEEKIVKTRATEIF